MNDRVVLLCCVFVGVIATVGLAAEPAAVVASAPADLRCEYLVDPSGIDVVRPRLSWELTSEARGARQVAYQIEAASTVAKLAAGDADLWNSGRVDSNATNQIVYGGEPLKSRSRVFWRVRVWDGDGVVSEWSAAGRWTVGLLEPADWKAKWIGEAATGDTFAPGNNGYHSAFVATADAVKWIVIDLGELKSFNAVKLYPARPYDWREDVPGFMFPVRFRIEASNDATFADSTTIVDRTAEDVANPGVESVDFEFKSTHGRYIRLTVTRLGRRSATEFGLALAEMEVLHDGKNLAGRAIVTASDSIETNDWSPDRLVDGDLVSHGPRGVDPLTPPMMRKAFALQKDAEISRATVYVTAQGLYALSLNGKRVGDRQLAPEWTDYHRRIQYQTYDVTSMVRSGENALVAQLADGWYAGRIGLTHIVPGGRPRGIYGRRPQLLFQLEVEYSDGRRELIVSDGSWKYTLDGAVRVADLLDGETIDARRRVAGVSEPAFDDGAWNAAREFAPPMGELVAQRNEPIRVTQEVMPIGVSEPKPGHYVFDMGQNMVGWCRLSVAGTAGQEITLRHAEVLNPDGTIYVENLRAAVQTDRYTLAGEGVETFEPQFTYHGFRFVEVTGLVERPALSVLTGCVVHSAANVAGGFECSDPMLNKLWSNIRWTQRANMMSVPTDCPQRDERLGWTGDILAFAQTATFNLDMAAFFEKWMRDMRDAQTKDGRFPDFAPHPFDAEVRFSGVPAWGDAGVFVPWTAYVNYGDTRIIEENYDAMKRWIDWIHRENPDLLWKNKRHNDYGDWLNADTLKLAGWPEHGAEMPKEAFATAFFARSTELFARMAEAIGRLDDAKRYGELAGRIRAAFNNTYVNDDGRMEGDTQAGYAIALHFELLPASKRAAAAKRMAETFKRYDGNIATGFHSTICLMNELTANGYNDEAYRLITNRTMPSWGYAIDHGATTIWERWDGYVEGRGFQNPGMNSFAHYALGSVGEWMMRSIVGINPDPAHPGYERVVIRPMPGGELTWARGHLDTIRGRVDCDWKIERKRMALQVSIPANVTAEIHVPTANPDEVRMGGQAFGASEDVEVLRRTDRAVVCRVGAGDYEFSSPWK
ncbi:MAG: family 78 glycoside hydrolase catalytic domain [Phycisphaerales bacterium]|nr:family 78 glycoside hydrolase catalytic domain [Phycisphaerales bacterium]